MSGLKGFDFNKLTREEQNMVEESVYTIMEKLKNTPLKLDDKMPQKPSTIAMPLEISAPGLSSTKVARVIHYGDPTLDEDIVIPKYDYATMNID